MAKLVEEYNNIRNTVLHQLKSYWMDTDEQVIDRALPNTLKAVEKNFYQLPNKRFYNENSVLFSPYMSVQWMIFLYRLSHEIYCEGGGTAKEADQVYYLNKIMHSNDWFYAIELPQHFLCEHPIGSVLGRANYGDYFFVYQGTTVGGNRSKGILSYPTIGENVIMFANSTILGNAHIGSNVVVAADTYIINENVPDNCIVFGKSPNLVIKKKSEIEIKKYTQHIWKWEMED